jgi:SAM-dependent methyltransferase
MVEKARRNASLLGLRDAEFVQAGVERLPLPDGSVDVVLSNGVFNLCPDKPAVLAEASRVLRPGGRLQLADILLHDDVTPEEVAQKGAWSDWITGAVWGRSLLQLLAEAGFDEGRIHGWTGYHTSSCTEGALITARKPS